jgi:hypothetical protein
MAKQHDERVDRTKASSPTERTKEENRQEKINRLLTKLNDSETKSEFWQISHKDYHIAGVRPVTRTTVEILGKDGFNPYEKKIDEILFKYYKIFIVEDKEEFSMEPEICRMTGKKMEIEDNGAIYLKSNDLLWIYNAIRDRN